MGAAAAPEPAAAAAANAPAPARAVCFGVGRILDAQPGFEGAELLEQRVVDGRALRPYKRFGL